MKVIELIGGIGAGKSRVLSILEQEYGAVVIQADQVAKDLEKKNEAGYVKLVEAFGEGILGPDGEIEAGKLSAVIFSDKAALDRVNRIIHPLVWEWIHCYVKAWRDEKSRTAAVSEQDLKRQTTVVSEQDVKSQIPDVSERDLVGSARPLLVMETALPDQKSDDIYDEVWYVYTLEEVRIRRLMENRGYSREKCLSIFKNQPSEETYCALADRIIDNNGSLDEMREQIAGWLGIG